MGGRGGSSGKRGGGGGGGLTAEEQRYLDTHRGNRITVGGEERYVAQWFHDRELFGKETGSVVRETEKAVLVKTRQDMGDFDRHGEQWIPKSVLQTKKEYAKAGVESVKNRQQSWKYSDYLKERAKEAGIKIGRTSSWEKIQDKLKKKGVPFKTRDQF